MKGRIVIVQEGVFWAIVLIIFWLNSCNDGKRVMNAIDPEHKRPIPAYDEEPTK